MIYKASIICKARALGMFVVLDGVVKLREEDGGPKHERRRAGRSLAERLFKINRRNSRTEQQDKQSQSIHRILSVSSQLC